MHTELTHTTLHQSKVLSGTPTYGILLNYYHTYSSDETNIRIAMCITDDFKSLKQILLHFLVWICMSSPSKIFLSKYLKQRIFSLLKFNVVSTFFYIKFLS